MTKLKRDGTMHLHDTSLNIWEEHPDEDKIRPVLVAMIGKLQKRGFVAERDPHVLKNYPSIAKNSYTGKKGDLEFHARLCGRHIQLEFFQNVVSGGNRNGGRYDFGKYRLMPHRMRLQFIVEMSLMARALCDIGYRFLEHNRSAGDVYPDPLTIRDRAEGRGAPTPLGRFNGSWGEDRFKRDESGWPTKKEYESCGGDRDRDKRPMGPGDTRYFRLGGRLMRATVYPNMNGMWQVVYGGSHTWMNGSQLFCCDRPDQEPRRLVSGQLERLEREIAAAIKKKDYPRVAELGVALKMAAERAKS